MAAPGIEEPGDLLQLHLERLGREVSKYDNSSVDDEAAEPWTCSTKISKLLVAACQCACSVYKPSVQPSPDLIPMLSKTPSITGTIKATSIWKNNTTKTLFVSVRGTACAADHMVNLNKESRDAAATFKFDRGAESISAHRGFLACANVLLPWLTEEVLRQVELDPMLKHIVFTGHSAGGAVAAVAFLHFACQSLAQLSFVDLSLVTFGSPPITSINVTELAKRQHRVEHVLAFVNEFDLVPRLDRSYMLSLVDLYRSSYGLPPTSPDDSSDPQLQRGEGPGGTEWKLPSPDYHIVGDIVVLRSKIDLGVVFRPGETDFDTLVAPSQRLDMVHVSPQEFQQLLFCDVSAHKRRLYLERLEKLS
ncbi:Fc.00g011450.m01.CDS01 [Cosmosporella sp. VM-42]